MRTRDLDRDCGATAGGAEHTGRHANVKEADPSVLGFFHQAQD